MSKIAPSIRHLAVPTADLRLHPDNPRRGDLPALKGSLAFHGQYRPIVVNRQTMEVLVGNHTLRAARELGWTEIAATFVDVGPEQGRRILAVDNRTNDLAGYDSQALAALLTELGDLDGTGYDDDALADLLDELAPPPLGEDEPPPLPSEPETRLGDLYLLGDHRLQCADARYPQSYAGLLDRGPPGAAMWSDPPYGVD